MKQGKQTAHGTGEDWGQKTEQACKVRMPVIKRKENSLWEDASTPEWFLR